MSKGSHRIWLNDSFYVPVAENGNIECPYFEGSLGCILKVTSAHTGGSLALKIPRLLADTPRENAYIARLLEDERRAVLAQIGNNSQGLLPAQLIDESVLAHQRQTETSAFEDARAQHKTYIFVSFAATSRPRFCVVKLEDNMAFSVYPPGCGLDVVELLGAEGARKLHGMLSRGRLESPLVLEEQAPQSPGPVHLEGLLDAATSRTTWYAGVPAYLMNWGGGTLQEAIDRGAISDWNVRQHLRLAGRVLQGVVSLHTRAVLHADIRPANVMYMSSPDNPEDYAVSDYGSFSREFTALARTGAPSGETQVGPSIGGLRVSPFYAPERRSGQELESANVAIITRHKTDQYLHYVIFLGWRSDLLDAGGAFRTEILQSPESDWKAVEGLASGDRLRLRNYVFSVAQVQSRSGVQRIVCNGKFATIMHDRIVVYPRGDVMIPDREIVSLPGFTEYRQWSAATDIYGVGSVSLYAVFCCAWARYGAVSQPGETRRTDELFAEMMEVLDSGPYFAHFRAEIGQVVREFKRILAEGSELSSQQVADYLVVEDGQSNATTFRQMVLETTNKIVGSAPWIRVIVLHFEMNPLKFILYLHFILSCLHRSSTSMSGRSEESSAAPFCRSRLDSPADGGALKALKWLETISDGIISHLFSHMAALDKEIVPYNPTSDLELRLHVQNLHGIAKPHCKSIKEASWFGALGRVRESAGRMSSLIDKFENRNKLIPESKEASEGKGSQDGKEAARQSK